MAWKKVSPELVERLDRAVAGYATEKRTMFGCPVHFVGGNMFAGAHQENLFIRLAEGDRKEIFQRHPGATLFEPMKGRIMKEYAVLPAALLEDAVALGEWLARAHDYVASLPPKEPRKGKKSEG